MMSDFAAPVGACKCELFGFYSQYDLAFDLEIGSKQSGVEGKRKYIIFNNILNGLSYILSPLIGIIRIIFNACLLQNDPDFETEKKDKVDAKKGYYKAQIARGVFELFGGGYLAWIPDILLSIPHMRHSIINW